MKASYPEQQPNVENLIVQNMNLVGQDVVLEAVRKHHDGVKRKRATDQCGHTVLLKTIGVSG